MNPNPKACKKCGGRCCKVFPGSYYPEDFMKDGVLYKRAIREVILSHVAQIDYWEGEFKKGNSQTAYFLRAPIASHPLRIPYPAWPGACSLLTNEGCLLPFSQRPWECRHLIPSPDGNSEKCGIPELKGEATKKACCQAWWPYRKILRSLEAQLQ